MNAQATNPISLQVGQQVVRNDDLSGQVVSTDGELFEVLWDDGARYHYRANGHWCGSWGVDWCNLDVRAVEDPGYVESDEVPLADRLDTFANYAIVFGWGLVAGVVLQYFWPL